MTNPRFTFVPLAGYPRIAPEEAVDRARSFRDEMRGRRTVRDFSDREVSRDVISACLEAAGTAPNGANMQPWHFVVISDSEVKSTIREAAEREEREFYTQRAPPEWLEALAPLGTDEHKPFLETAPYLIAIFAESYSVRPDGKKVKNYYVTESVGIATGILITGLHRAGLATLTHTPSPMGFLQQILGRPDNERAYMLIAVGYPESGCEVPDLTRKRLEDILTTF